MNCLICDDGFSWSTLEPVAPHVFLVMENDVRGAHPPCGVAINADVPGVPETFLCLSCATTVGRATQKALKAIGVSA